MNPSKINLSGLAGKTTGQPSYEELKKASAAKAAETHSSHPSTLPASAHPPVHDIAVVDVPKLISTIEADAINKKFGHLGVGDYDKLLIEKVREHITFVPEINKDIHLLITASVKRYAVHTEKK